LLDVFERSNKFLYCNAGIIGVVAPENPHGAVASAAAKCPRGKSVMDRFGNEEVGIGRVADWREFLPKKCHCTLTLTSFLDWAKGEERDRERERERERE
ncbi:hypothetical protein PFISCL1PPCAC_13159, partial [Pristionchus fissidentatus]